MKRVIENQSCELYHTVYCDLLNMPNCSDCFVNDKNADAAQIKRDLDVMQSLLPSEGISHLFTKETCQFCKDTPNARTQYALVDMGHVEPVREKRTVIGIKTKTKIGTILPLQIGICDRCRKCLRRAEMLPFLIPACTAALLLLIFMISSVNEGLSAISTVMPFVIFVGAVALSIAIGSIIGHRLQKKYAKEVHMDVFELPTLAKMRAIGWFLLNESKNQRAKILFSKKRMQMGVGTGTSEDALCKQQ